LPLVNYNFVIDDGLKELSSSLYHLIRGIVFCPLTGKVR